MLWNGIVTIEKILRLDGLALRVNKTPLELQVLVFRTL